MKPIEEGGGGLTSTPQSLGAINLGNLDTDPDTTTSNVGDIYYNTIGSAVKLLVNEGGGLIWRDIAYNTQIAKSQVVGTAVTLADTGTITSAMIGDTQVTVSKLATSSVTNAKVSTTAAIDPTKIAGTAVTLTSGTALYATNAGTSTYATTAGTATYATTSGTAVNITGTIAATQVTGTAITAADTGTVTNTMLAGSITNAKLSNSSITVTAGSGISGGGTASLGGTVTVTNAGVLSVNGSTGAITNVPKTNTTNTFTVPGQQINATNTATNLLTLFGAATQTGYFINVTDSSGSTLWYIDSAGIANGTFNIDGGSA